MLSVAFDPRVAGQTLEGNELVDLVERMFQWPRIYSIAMLLMEQFPMLRKLEIAIVGDRFCPNRC